MRRNNSKTSDKKRRHATEMRLVHRSLDMKKPSPIRMPNLQIINEANKNLEVTPIRHDDSERSYFSHITGHSDKGQSELVFDETQKFATMGRGTGANFVARNYSPSRKTEKNLHEQYESK